ATSAGEGGAAPSSCTGGTARGDPAGDGKSRGVVAATVPSSSGVRGAPANTGEEGTALGGGREDTVSFAGSGETGSSRAGGASADAVLAGTAAAGAQPPSGGEGDRAGGSGSSIRLSSRSGRISILGASWSAKS